MAKASRKYQAARLHGADAFLAAFMGLRMPGDKWKVATSIFLTVSLLSASGQHKGELPQSSCAAQGACEAQQSRHSVPASDLKEKKSAVTQGSDSGIFSNCSL